MNDPYKTLGVEPSASDEDIKKAYRELVRKYHPDKYAGTDLAELATEKMKEVNAAYEQIQAMRSGNRQSTGGAGGNAYGGSYGRAYGGTYGGTGSAEYAEVRNLINRGAIDEAEAILLGVDAGARNAEWNYLMGCIAARRRYYADALRYFDTACQQDPYNIEYRMGRDELRRYASGSAGGYQTASASSDICDCCTTLLCLNLCCGGRGGLLGC